MDMIVEEMMKMVVCGLQQAADENNEKEADIHLEVLTYILDKSPDKEISTWVWLWLNAKISDNEEMISRSLFLREKEKEKEKETKKESSISAIASIIRLEKLNINEEDMSPLL